MMYSYVLEQFRKNQVRYEAVYRWFKADVTVLLLCVAVDLHETEEKLAKHTATARSVLNY